MVRSIREWVWAIGAVAALTTNHGALAAPMMASSWSGIVYDIDLTTGAATNPRSNNVFCMIGLAHTPTGLYTLNAIGPDDGQSLFRLNYSTGQSTLIGSAGTNFLFEGDTAYNPIDGKLYGGFNSGPGSGIDLFTVNIATGAATIIGAPSSSGDISGLAFTSGGTLYGLISQTATLLTIDPTTAAIMSSRPLTGDTSTGGLGGLAWNPDDQMLYMINGDLNFVTRNLYRIDPVTAVSTLIGPTGVTNLSGITFIPEPTLLAPMALLSLLAQRRRLRRFRA